MQKNDSHEQHAHQNTQRERPYTVYDHKVAFLDAIFHEGTGQPIHVLNMGGGGNITTICGNFTALSQYSLHRIGIES